jgi:hypothetical protein
MPRHPLALTAQQILESYDLTENQSSDNEDDLIERRIETSEDEAYTSPDDEDDDISK